MLLGNVLQGGLTHTNHLLSFFRENFKIGWKYSSNLERKVINFQLDKNYDCPNRSNQISNNSIFTKICPAVTYRISLSPPSSPPRLNTLTSNITFQTLRLSITPAFSYYPNEVFFPRNFYIFPKMSWRPSFSLMPSQLENEIRRFGGGKNFKWKKNSFQSDIKSL